jgi:DNA-binding CsgD family transcriptional regulator
MDMQALHRLSGQEKRVLSLYITGMRPKIIAEDLQITKNTLKTYLRRIGKKLDIKNFKDIKNAL